MAELIVPGTSIEVRAEGLIIPGRVSISNVAIVGTARRGPVNVVMTPSNIGEARDIFGTPDAFNTPEEVDAPFTLVRALELAYLGGAQRVYAVRVARGAGDARGLATVYNIPADTGNVVVQSRYPGSGYNDAELRTEAVTVPAGDPPLLNVTFLLGRLRESWRDVPAAAAEFAQVINGTHPTYPYNTNASTRRGSDLFVADADDAEGNIVASDEPGIQQSAGTSGATAIGPEYQAGLDALINEDVHIIVLAGQSFEDMGMVLAAHCENASTDTIRRDRIGIIGSNVQTTDTNAMLADLRNHGMDSSRIVVAGPGIQVNDAVTGNPIELPGSYTAAAIAGVISALDPHFSPTNKPVRVNGVATKFNGTQLEQLVLNRVLVLEDRLGATKIVQGITSSVDTAWKQITTRRIVDYAKFGIRSGCESYIGKLNNERVRQALKGTLNSFLADMVDREMLISYDLDVTATRAQQIRGIAAVTMTLRPTFSIDYIQVTMYLE